MFPDDGMIFLVIFKLFPDAQRIFGLRFSCFRTTKWCSRRQNSAPTDHLVVNAVISGSALRQLWIEGAPIFFCFCRWTERNWTPIPTHRGPQLAQVLCHVSPPDGRVDSGKTSSLVDFFSCFVLFFIKERQENTTFLENPRARSARGLSILLYIQIIRPLLLKFLKFFLSVCPSGTVAQLRVMSRPI